jgi:hypothetical protein
MRWLAAAAAAAAGARHLYGGFAMAVSLSLQAKHT